MFASTPSFLLLSGIFQAVVHGRTRLLPRDGPSSSLPYDDKTTKYCSSRVDYSSSTACFALLDDHYITLKSFRRWVCLLGGTDSLTSTDLP
jgi:hypothetical protein